MLNAMSYALCKVDTIHLQKVSIHVSFQNLRSLTWIETFSLSLNFQHVRGSFYIMIQSVVGQGEFYEFIVR